jgi:hypothetical protein
MLQLIEDPRFELVAVGTSTEGQGGRDAGDAGGMDTVTGITAALGFDAVHGRRTGCRCTARMGDTRPIEAHPRL